MKRIKYSFVIILVFIIDQISKIVVANNINLNESRVVIKNFLNLTYVKNKGAAFGMFEGYTSIITIISVVILFYLLYELFKNKKNDTLTNISLSFIIGGLIGNLYGDTTLHSMLAAMKYPDYPVALGVIRSVEDDSVYDRAVEKQVEEVKATSKIHCVDDLLRSGATWEVE